MASVDIRERLRQHFDALPPEKQAGGWNAMWEQNVTPWDRGEPSPALVDTLQYKLPQIEASSSQDTSSNKTPNPSTRRKKALVPGCGRGYDVLLLASYGYDAYGLDTSTLAIQGAQELARSPDRATKYPPATNSAGTTAGPPGTATFLEADFFSDDFLAQTHPPTTHAHAHAGPDQPPEEPKTFDLIYDYTFLCALPPALRPAWSKRMSRLLSPAAGGILICLEFPLQKPPSSGGPPHGLTRELYEQLLNRPGKGVEYTTASSSGEGGEGGGYVIEDRTTEMPRDALVKVERWKAERTHAVGMGMDFVSVWKHVQ
ncbi:hypothetical protein KC356_g7909 [Hortaea werneckii]|nr:hypothetical protein KC356_g7909 [Hortaea werneckii]